MIEPDAKDWTWVLDRPCAACGFAADAVAPAELGSRIRESAAPWSALLSVPGATTRPDEVTWSPAEYACHVRDVHRLFADRVRLMLDQDDPVFANWDQDATALEQRYDLADPLAVGHEVVTAAEAVARLYDGVRGRAWQRTGRRSNGSVFTVASLGRYHLHDVVHHLDDVARQSTEAAYDADARAYRDATLTPAESDALVVARLVGELPAGARVLEIGSGGGRDALLLEAAGLRVRRTDVTPGFVALLRADGHDADVLDPLTDDLADNARGGAPYDAVWANACLLHVARPDLPTVLRRLAAATRADGLLWLTLKEGDGDGWSTHGAVGAPRRFVYWREPALREVLADAGWAVGIVETAPGRRGESWLLVQARRT